MFRTRYSLYKWLITPFSLANILSTFQKYINWVLQDFLDDFCSAYIDNILIYSLGSLQDYRDKVKSVLSRLQEVGLQCDLGKCEFEIQSTKYLRFIIKARKGIRIDSNKIKAIREQEALTIVKGVQGFLGFINFCRRFIQQYSQIVLPLIALTKKNQPFIQTPNTKDSFQHLKRIFTIEPTLVQFDYNKPTRVEANSSGQCIGGILLQPNSNSLFLPYAFFSKKLSLAEYNYKIYNKEILAIV